MTTSFDLSVLDQDERLLYQVSGPPDAPPIVYIPGVHGDWTPMQSVRPLLGQSLRLVEVTYPRAAAWSLEDFADALRALLDELGIGRAHLLAESFGSLVGWTFALRHPGRVRSLIIAGGFSRSPGALRVALARSVLRCTPSALLDFGVARYVRGVARHYGSLGPPQSLPWFAATCTPRGWRATRNRFRLIASTDLRARLGEIACPVAYLGGARDRVVPVRREVRCLERLLPAHCRFRHWLLPGMPHPVLPASPRRSTELITAWIAEHEASDS